MADIHDIRAQLREARLQPVQTSGGGGGGVPFWLMAAGAAVIGFGVVLFAPRFYTKQRTAGLPVAHETTARVEPPAAEPQTQVPAQPAAALPPPAAPAGQKANYSGRSADETAMIADAVCAPRTASRVLSAPKSARTSGDGSDIQDENERLHCLLTEGPTRYCSRSQRQKITADVINYFKGIEYTNTSMRVVANVQTAMASDGQRAVRARASQIIADPRVIDGIEGLMRAGYLTKANRDDIGANVPRDLKLRFDRVVGLKLPCPDPPWWMIWK